MTEVLNSINNMYQLLVKKSEHYAVLVAEGKKQLSDLEAAKKALDVKIKEVALREEKVGVVENAEAIRLAAEKIKREAEATLVLAKEEQKRIMEWCSSEQKKAANEMKNTLSNIEALKEREKKLDDARKALDVEKKNYKENIIREIGKMTSANT